MLTAIIIAKAQPKEKDYILPDTDNLYLRVYPNGEKTWLVRYMIDGKARKKSLGSYPEISLAKARVKKDAFLQAIRSGDITGGEIRTFESVAEAWLARRKPAVSEQYYRVMSHRLSMYVYPEIGKADIKSIRRPQLVHILSELSDRGLEETAHRVASLVEGAFTHAINLGIIELSPAQYLSTALPDRVKERQHFKAATKPEEIASLMRAIQATGSEQVRNILRMVAYTGVRIGELLRATWKEFNLKEEVWIIPKEHMKKRLPLCVPLSRQMIELVQEVKDFNKSRGLKNELLFPSQRPRKHLNAPVTEAAVLKSLKYLCWENPGTPATSIHGFRKTMSSVLNEAGYNPDAIERQLAHVSHGVRGIYNLAEYMDIRRPMMQWYADYLDALRDNLPLPSKP